MLHAAIQVVLYGLLAGLTAVGFAATLAVMPSGRLKALGFGAGFVVAQLLTCSALVIFGIAATGLSRENHPGLRAALEIALATALVWGPLILFLLLGTRVIELMEGAQDEVGRRQPQITVYGLLLLAALFVVDAVSVLLT